MARSRSTSKASTASCRTCAGCWARWPSSSLKARLAMPTIGVVGLGLMGASFAMAVKKARPEMTIVGFDHDAATVRKAMDRGIASVAGSDLGAIDMADAVVVAVPI